MKPKIIIFMGLLPLFCLVLGTCDTGEIPIPERPQMMYTVSIIYPEHGALTAIPNRASQGTEIFLLVNPDSGYILKEGGLLDNGASLGSVRFDMPGRNVHISAEYIPVPEGNYTVTMAPVDNGYISASSQYGPLNREIRLTVRPNPGYALKDGLLNLSDGRVLTAPPYTFSLGDQNITVRGTFIPETAGALLDSGKKALAVGDYTGAAAYFEAAYTGNPNDPETIFYSSLGNFASIAVDTNVRNLIKSRLGFSRYPAALGELFSKGWMIPYEGVYLPGMSGPSGFQNHYLYQNNGGGMSPTLKLFSILVWVCFIDRNKSGWNDLLDDALEFVFGDTFEAAVKRAETMPANQRIILDDPNIIKSLGLENYFNPGDSIGKVELDAVIGFLRAGKASLEWLSAYDWATDVNYYPYDLGLTFNEIVYEILQRFEGRMANPHKMDPNVLERILPLKNNFLRNRNRGMMPKARNDFIRAVVSLNAAWKYYSDTAAGSGPAAVSRKMKDDMGTYPWIGDGLAKLKSAMDSGGDFYFSREKPAGNTWPAAGEAEYGINIHKLFTPEQLTIDRLLITEGNGRAPVIFGLDGSATGAAITGSSQFDQYTSFDFRLNVGSLREVFVKGFGQYNETEWFHTLFPNFLLNRSNAAKIYDWYHKR